MKEIYFILFALLIANNSYSQNADKYLGNYMVLDRFVTTEGGDAGFRDTIERSISILKEKDSVLIQSFAGGVTVYAVIDHDSLFVPLQFFEPYGEIISIRGFGKFLEDTLWYKYFGGSTAGNVEGECIAVKTKMGMNTFFYDTNTHLKSYPNPFTENTKISFFVPKQAQTAQLCVYDLTGKQLKQLTITERGETSVSIQGQELQAGIYLYALLVDGQLVDSKRMVLTK